MTKVVNIYHEKCDVYIGRKGKGQDGYFGNEHPVYDPEKPWTECKLCQSKHTREESLEEYKKDFKTLMEIDIQFSQRVKELKGRSLGCFCRPKKGFQGKLMCHGQIIAGFLENVMPESIP